jgi:hypothetical protein
MVGLEGVLEADEETEQKKREEHVSRGD